jgi:hypothetical protein
VDRLSTAIAKNTFKRMKLPQMNRIRKYVEAKEPRP